MEEVFRRIRSEVERELSCSAHDMDHVNRVYRLCLELAQGQDVDMDVLKAAALLHDIARVKEDNDKTGSTNHAAFGAEMAGSILREAGFPEEKISHVQDCVRSHRFKTDLAPKTLEAKMLFDADKVDITGAIGIARGYMWAGRNGANLYKKVDSIEEYARENLSNGKLNGRVMDKTRHSPQIEYHIKWKRIIGKLHTEKAREICRERMGFVKEFMDRLEREVNGEL